MLGKLSCERGSTSSFLLSISQDPEHDLGHSHRAKSHKDQDRKRTPNSPSASLFQGQGPEHGQGPSSKRARSHKRVLLQHWSRDMVNKDIPRARVNQKRRRWDLGELQRGSGTRSEPAALAAVAS